MIPKFKCLECGQKHSPKFLGYRCKKCGGVFKLDSFNNSLLDTDLTLGEGDTPLLKTSLLGHEVYLKLDYLMPTGSFKDRGAVVLLDQISRMGVKKIIEDSSGNAGAAVAAYAAAANIECTIYLPEDTSRKKINQISAFGAEIKKVPGNRDETARAVAKSAQKVYYASHVYNPLFIAGVSSLALELKSSSIKPETIFVPVGNGSLLLGLYYGFKQMGWLPRLVGVQSQNCSPIYNTIKGINKEDNLYQKTIAKGIAISQPVRKKEIIEAVKESRGKILTVSENKIITARKKLSQKGIYVEPTAAVALAGFMKCVEETNKLQKDIVIPLTGSGLKQ